MENLNINKILDREKESEQVKLVLKNFEQNSNDLTIKKGIYIYGEPGSGKTDFVTNVYAIKSRQKQSWKSKEKVSALHRSLRLRQAQPTVTAYSLGWKAAKAVINNALCFRHSKFGASYGMIMASYDCAYFTNRIVCCRARAIYKSSVLLYGWAFSIGLRWCIDLFSGPIQTPS